MKMARILIPKSKLWVIIASLGLGKSQNFFFQILKQFWARSGTFKTGPRMKQPKWRGNFGKDATLLT